MRRIFAVAMAGGLGLGVLVYGFVRLVEDALPSGPGLGLLYALLVGLLIGLALLVVARLALRQAAYDLHTFAVELTDATLPAPAALGGDDVVYMRATLGAALRAVPRSDELPGLAHELGAAGDVGVALDLAAGRLARHLPVQGAVLLTVDAERGVLVPAATWGMARLDRTVTLDLDETAIGRALLERREMTYSGMQVRELLPLQLGPESLTLFCFPQYAREQPVATLCLVAEAGDTHLGDDQRVFVRAVADLLLLAVQQSIYRRLFLRESERLVAFEQLGGLLSGSQRLDQALEQVLRVAARVTDSAHGTLLLLETDESRVRYRVTLKEGDVLPLSVTAPPILKHGLAGWSLRERRADIVADTERDSRWLPVPGLEVMRSALVVPLLFGERALGVLTLADPIPRHYGQRSLALCSALAAYAVTILARVQYEQIVASGSAALARRLFEGHLGPERLADLLGDAQRLRGVLDPQVRELVVICAGLRGLDWLRLAPTVLFEQVLTPYLAALAAIVHEHNGYLTLRDDGAVLMMFGFPAAPGDKRVRAMHAAQAIQAAARRLRARWRTQLGDEITLSAGIAAGSLVTGVVGDQRFRAVGAFGSVIGEAARIQRLARPDEVLVADSLANSFGADGLFPLERLAPLANSEGEAPRSVYRLASRRA